MDKLDRVDEIMLRNGISLTKEGLGAWGHNRINSLIAIAKLYNLKVPILGGDVCIMDDKGKFHLTYDNWYCNRNIDESSNDYAQRSCLAAESYIRKYHIEDKQGTILFILVLDIPHRTDFYKDYYNNY
ncbi:Imm40 family immunity protein [uncultured Bacteroides sp.]|uniref:Imm40 family immunity protein n=1 Tax=uncultured Bacteroides sp. TaxID=162156 RepID=UPI002AABC1EB|nr:Imm40 family immunity protein [uncultured Bacteroides sp.]